MSGYTSQRRWPIWPEWRNGDGEPPLIGQMGVANPPPLGQNWPPPFSPLGVVVVTPNGLCGWQSFFCVFFIFIFLDILKTNTCIWGNFRNFVSKIACATHLCHFPSKKEMGNRVLILKNFKTLLGYIVTF
jgi:hypothetical protein